MGEIIIMGLSGEAKTLPMTATKEKIVETIVSLAKQEEQDTKKPSEATE